MAKVRVGISGWRYPPWRGKFYPRGLVQREELAFASRRFATIELNGSFYSLQSPRSYARWREATPRGFVFAIKGPRYITHVRRLRGIEAPLANFFASGLFELRGKLGPLLWQFPANFRYDLELFARFCERLPRDTAGAAHLAARHDARVTGRARISIDRNRRLRHAVEIRNRDFLQEEFIALLRRHGIALVVADTAGRWPRVEELTAGFMYLRLHGDKELYSGGYDDAALARWARRIHAWQRGSQPRDAARIVAADPPRRAGRDVYCYFDNDLKVHAPFDAARLASRLGEAWAPAGMRDQAMPGQRWAGGSARWITSKGVSRPP